HLELKKYLENLYRTPEKHWHIYLEEDNSGNLALQLSKTSSKVSLAPFEIKLNQGPLPIE
ncbi:MAG: hypothetical protein J0I81_16150, partial [Hyphomicrobium sp.]|nr:hypothetical protein [Hyphomicrobium sp.]